MTEEHKTPGAAEPPVMAQNFIHDFIDEDIAQGGQFQGMAVHTRFPPEPNGYLHIGHAKAIFIDFGTAEKYGGLCNLRMDDTNPTKEDVEYVEAIQEDIHWLGYDWGDRFFYASDYFEQMYEYAVELIKKGLAYVCALTPEEFREYRGDVNTPARSPWRDRPVEESLDLFARMKAGEFPNGKYTLRAKIDLSSGNFNMRDPVLYRINHMHHHRPVSYTHLSRRFRLFCSRWSAIACWALVPTPPRSCCPAFRRARLGFAASARLTPVTGGLNLSSRQWLMRNA